MSRKKRVMRVKWTVQQERLLRKHYPYMHTRELAVLAGHSYPSTKCKAVAMGLQKKIMSGSPWTPGKVKELVALYPGMFNAVIAKKLGVNEAAVDAKAFKLGLAKSKEFIREKGKIFGYPKGHVPVNAGKKQHEYMSAESIRKTKATRFKKGDLPHNTKYNGAISLRKETMRSGEVRYYKWVRVAKSRWRMLHVVKWEAKHGRVPAGHIVVFKNKNTMDLKMKNLKCISMAENMRRNSIHNLPAPLKKSIITIGKLTRKINQREKQII